MLSCGHGKELGNVIGVFITLIKVVVKLIISSVILEPPPHAPNDRASSHITETSPTEHL